MDGVAKVKTVFFDRRAVIDRIGKANAQVMAKAGSFVRRTAKGSIRYTKTAVSKPGEPPRAHRGKSGNSPLRELIFFAFDDATNSLVIGPTPFRGAAIAPRTLELGGSVSPYRNPLRTIRKIGNGGEIRIDGPAGKGRGKNQKDRFSTKKNRFGRVVTYARLNTQAQVERANRLQRELYGPFTIGPTSIAPRPYMGPALEENLPKLPMLWANSVR